MPSQGKVATEVPDAIIAVPNADVDCDTPEQWLGGQEKPFGSIVKAYSYQAAAELLRREVRLLLIHCGPAIKAVDPHPTPQDMSALGLAYKAHDIRIPTMIVCPDPMGVFGAAIYMTSHTTDVADTAGIRALIWLLLSRASDQFTGPFANDDD